MKAILAILLIVLPVVAQTNSDFRQRYQSSEVGTYVVRPNIIMSVKFADEFLWKDYACEAVIKHEATTTSNEVSPITFSSESALEIIDEVVPIAQRGKLINELSVNGGCTGMRISMYERVIINRVTRCETAGGGTYQVSIKWKATWCEGKKRYLLKMVASPNKLLQRDF